MCFYLHSSTNILPECVYLEILPKISRPPKAAESMHGLMSNSKKFSETGA